MTTDVSDPQHHGPLYDMRALGFAAGERVVVTGAGSGIGKATALMAAHSGLSVVIWERLAEKGQLTAREIAALGGKAQALTVDVADHAAVVRAWEETLKLGPCQYLVNNAGPASSDTGPFEQNLTATVGSVHRVTTEWMARCPAAASVVNITSIGGNFRGSGAVQPFYPTAKTAIVGYTRNLAVSANGKPRVNAVAPGIIVTPRTLPALPAISGPEMMSRIPSGRLGTPEDIASAILFLLSPAASYINGVLLPVDGGLVVA